MDAASAKGSEPRAHHFVPQCWLAGFTEAGQKTGTLFVTDLKRRRQWQSSPPKAGHRRDFYRVSHSKLDPIFFETAFGKIENIVAPVLKTLYEDPRDPTDEELAPLLYFVALQHIRVPGFRPLLKRVDSIYRSFIAEALKTPETWARALEAAGIPTDSPGASYEEMSKSISSDLATGCYSLNAPTEFFLGEGFRIAAETITPALRRKFWTTIHSPSGSFIGSDNPVMLDGPKGAMVGFESADFIIFPLNRFLLLAGADSNISPPFVNRRRIARHNTFTMVRAEHVYSHVSNFCWLDEDHKVQTNWELFSKQSVIEAN